MKRKIYDCDDYYKETTLREDYALLLIENIKLKQKLENFAGIIDCIAEEHEEFLCRDDLIKIIESQAETINDLKKYLAGKNNSNSSSGLVFSLAARNSVLCSALLNSISRNTDLHEQIINILDNQIQNI